jgi:hypothetical protein
MEEIDLVVIPKTHTIDVNPENPNIATTVVKATPRLAIPRRTVLEPRAECDCPTNWGESRSLRYGTFYSKRGKEGKCHHSFAAIRVIDESSAMMTSCCSLKRRHLGDAATVDAGVVRRSSYPTDMAIRGRSQSTRY